MYREGLHRLGQVFLHDGLHVLVDGQDQIAAVHGRVDVGLSVGKHVAAAVGLGNAAPRCAGKDLVIRFFQPVGAGTVGIAKAEHRGRECPVRVAAGGRLLGAQHHDAVPLLLPVLRLGAVVHGIFQDRIGDRLLHTAGYDAVLIQFAVGVGGRQHREHVLGRRAVAQQGGDLLGCLLQLRGRRAVFLRLFGVGDDVPHRAAFGQQLAVGAVDGPAHGGQLGIAHLLGHRLGAVQFCVAQLQRIELVDQNTKTKDQKDSDGKQRAPDDMRAGVRVGSVGWVGHGGSFGDANFPGLRRRACGSAAAGKKARFPAGRQTRRAAVVLLRVQAAQQAERRRAYVRECLRGIAAGLFDHAFGLQLHVGDLAGVCRDQPQLPFGHLLQAGAAGDGAHLGGKVVVIALGGRQVAFGR